MTGTTTPTASAINTTPARGRSTKALRETLDPTLSAGAWSGVAGPGPRERAPRTANFPSGRVDMEGAGFPAWIAVVCPRVSGRTSAHVEFTLVHRVKRLEVRSACRRIRCRPGPARAGWGRGTRAALAPPRPVPVPLPHPRVAAGLALEQHRHPERRRHRPGHARRARALGRGLHERGSRRSPDPPRGRQDVAVRPGPPVRAGRDRRGERGTQPQDAWRGGGAGGRLQLHGLRHGSEATARTATV